VAVLAVTLGIALALGTRYGFFRTMITGSAAEAIVEVIGYSLLTLGAVSLIARWSLLHARADAHSGASIQGRRVAIMALSRSALDEPKQLEALKVALGSVDGNGREIAPLPLPLLVATADELEMLRRRRNEIAMLRDLTDADFYRARDVWLGQRPAWQQNLRVIGTQLGFATLPRRYGDVSLAGPLERVYLILSAETAHTFPLFRELVRRVLAASGDDAPTLEILPAPSQVAGTGGFDDALQAIEACVTHALGDRHKRYRESDIAIDISSGERLLPVAATVATMNGAMVFTYMSNEGVATEFDARVQLFRFGGH
jgi:hypothetical protein